MSDPVTLTLGQKQAAICAAIKDGLPAVQTCEPLGRQLSPDGLSRAAVRLPAVYVTCAGVEVRPQRLSFGDLGGGVTINRRHAIWTAFLVVSDLMEPTAATDLLESLINVVSPGSEINPNFDAPLSGGALQRAENLYKGEVGNVPVCIYATRFIFD